MLAMSQYIMHLSVTSLQPALLLLHQLLLKDNAQQSLSMLHTHLLIPCSLSYTQIFWTGFTDCCVCRTQLSNRTSELVLVEEAPINDMVFDAQDSALWVATASSSVRRFVPPACMRLGLHQLQIL